MKKTKKIKQIKQPATKIPVEIPALITTEQTTWLDQLKHNRKLQLLISVALCLFLVVVLVIIIMTPQPVQQVAVVRSRNTIAKPIEPAILPRQLDGLMVAKADANRVPVCVMIENAAFSGVRPQSGLSAAQVVYEVIVEGGITRLMAVFGGEQADPVGPVRSARDTYLEFASELNCAYTHAGGSPTALQALSGFKMRDLDGLREPRWFWRDPSKVSPHNLFSKTDNLYAAVSKGHSWTDAPTYTPWHFVDDNDIATGEAAIAVNIHFGGAYDVTYRYNTTEQYYERYNGSTAHTDANTGKTLTTRNIIIEKVPAGQAVEGKGRINFAVTGEGEVYIFRLGKLTRGQWKKADRLSRTQFFIDDGTEIPLVRGTSWVEIVPETHQFDWQ